MSAPLDPDALQRSLRNMGSLQVAARPISVPAPSQTERSTLASGHYEPSGEKKRPYRWMPTIGEFDTSGPQIIFKGKEFPQSTSGGPTAPSQIMAPAIGLLLSNHRMLNGTLRTKVNFHQIAQDSVCECIISYDAKTKAMITAGIGGGFAMFSIREWIPPLPQKGGGSWVNHEVSGDRSNLRAGADYEVAARIQGSDVALHVDGVQVATATLTSSPNQQHQVGLFCVSRSDITISDFIAEIELPTAFIVMQFSSPYDELYSHVIKDACNAFTIEAVRADEIYGPGIIIKDVIERISRSQVVIADISPPNPNVYFEVGYALALGKPIILLAQRQQPDTKLPFDLSAFRVLLYDDSIGGKAKLEEGLRNHLKEILGNP